MILFVANEKGRLFVMVKITCTTISTFMGVVDGRHTSERSWDLQLSGYWMRQRIGRIFLGANYTPED